MHAHAAPNTIDGLAALYAARAPRRTLDDILKQEHVRRVNIGVMLKPLANLGENVGAMIRAMWAKIMQMVRRVAAVFGVEVAQPGRTPTTPDEAEVAMLAPEGTPDGQALVDAAAQRVTDELTQMVQQAVRQKLDVQQLLTQHGDTYLSLRLSDLGSTAERVREEIRAKTGILAEMVSGQAREASEDPSRLVAYLLSDEIPLDAKIARYTPEVIAAAQRVMDLQSDLVKVELQFSDHAIGGIQLARFKDLPQLDATARRLVAQFATEGMAAQIFELASTDVEPENTANGIKLASLDVNSAKNESKFGASNETGIQEVNGASGAASSVSVASLPRHLRFKAAGIVDSQIVPPQFDLGGGEDEVVERTRQRSA